MEQKASFTKKLLSTLLAMLMIFSACYAGVDGLGGLYTAYAAEGDSDYTKEEVAALINAATASGFTLTSSNNAWSYTADDGTALAAARAIFDYAVNTYREGKDATSAGNSTKALYDKFDADFSGLYTNAASARQLVKNVLNPDGTTVYSYESKGTKSDITCAETTDSMSKGADVSGTYPVASYPTYYASSETGTITKTVEIQIDMEKYLLTFATIEAIPSTIYTNVKYSYAHTYSSTATVTDVSSRSTTSTSGCSTTTTWYYTPTITTSYWNYMTAKPTKTETKDKTVRKTLLTLEKYFDEDLLAITKDDMLAMPLADITSLYKTTDLMYKNIKNADGTTKFSDNVLNHFGLNSAKIHQFMKDVYFAYRVTAAKYNIDNLNNLIGSEYNVNSYSQMSALYSKTSTAYNAVFSLDAEIKNYLINEGGYGDQYNAAIALKATAESYNATLKEIMTEQKLEETVASMVATYNQYYSKLNKEDIETPTDAEVIALDQKVKSFDKIVATYTGYSYYRTYWTTEYEEAWNDFSAKLAEVYEVRGLKATFQTQYDYFLPIIYTTMIDDLNNEDLIALYSELDTKLSELRTTYTDVANEWGYTIADKIFTVKYEGSDYLLQTLIDNVKSTGKEAAKTVLIARNDAQLDTIWAYHGVTTVDFSNFASIKSTLTYFDYDLYDYVSSQGWLTTDATTKYADVQTLLDRYHAFSTSDGKSFFNESFTYKLADGTYGTRYAGSQFDADGNQIGYPADLVRDGAEDNYVVTEAELLDTVDRIDNFIVSRDFGALIGLTDAEDEETYVDLATYLEQMLNKMLYTNDMMNTLVGAIYPMIVDLLNTELIGMLADMGTNDNPAASACIDIGEMTGGDGSGHLYVYMDDDLFNGNQKQRNLDVVLADAGLYVYPQTLADSLLMSDPVSFGVGTPIYTALKAAGRDWTQLVKADDPETEMVDETKVLEFDWGVYDEDSFVEKLACVFDSLLPLLNAVLTGKTFEEVLANAAYGYSTDTKYIVSVGKLAVFGDLRLTIPGLTVYNDVLVPLFNVLGVDKIPTLKQNASGEELVKAIVEPLLGVIDEVLENPISTVLEIFPNLVYFLSMDTIQEMLNSLNINLTLKIEAEVDKDNSGTLVDLLGNTLLDLLGDKLTFDVELKIADLLDLYELLGFEISDFNEVIKGIGPMLGDLTGGEGEGGLDLASILGNLPPIQQQEIIFCSDWSTFPNGKPNLVANKGDLMYWFINYAVQLLQPDENGNSLLTGLLGEMDPSITNIIDNVVYQFSSNPRGALAAIVELLNPVTYDLQSMDWVEGTWNYNGIAGTNAADMVYLSYSNDWTEGKANALVEEIDPLVASVLEMVEMDLGDAANLGEFLQGKINALFTNETITSLVAMLGGLGDSPSAVINDIIKNQVGIDLGSWFVAFGYLFPAETWAEDAEIIPYGHRNYVNNFGVEGVANEDGTITWHFNRTPLNDGDAYTFVNILTRLLGPAEILIKFLFAGENISAFADLVRLHGYETYSTTLGLLFEVLGVENLPSQADFDADTMGSFSNMLFALLDWFYALTGSDDMIAQLLEIVPDLFYYIESNGLSVLLHNLLMPVLVLVDTVRPLINLDVNGVLSLIVSELVNYGTMDINVILQYIVNGVWLNDDLDYKFISVDIKNLRVSDILVIVDNIFGTNLAQSNLVTYGVTGLCSGVETVNTNGAGTINKTTVTAADAITIILTGLLEALEQPAQDETMTNGEVIFAMLSEMLESETIAELYPTIKALFAGIEVTYTEPNWGYMLPAGGDIFTVGNARETISYLAYTTDWTPETADTLYAQLDELIAMIAADFDGNVAAIINSMLEDNVYSDANLNMIVELIVNLFADFNTSLFDLVDVLIDTDIAAWFAMCVEGTDAETGEPKLVCTKDWGVDEATDKRATFVAALKEVLTPANALLEWLFLGDDYAFFTGADKDADDNYIYNDVITLAGGAGYDRAIVPIFKALGIDLAPAASFATGVDAVEAILNSLFDLIDSLTTAESTIEGVVQLLPNLIYFLNADGVKSAVNNLLAPVNALLDMVGPLLGDGKEISITALLGDALPIDITDITTEAVLDLLTELKVGENEEPLNIQFVAYDEDGNELYDLGEILSTLYVGELSAYTYAENLTGYTLDITDHEGDVLTLVISFALEMFLLNEELFTGLLGEEAAAIIESISGLLKGYAVTYTDPDWAYMYEGDDALAKLAADGFPTVEFTYLAYANDWDEDVAVAAYDALDEILVMIMDSVAKGSTIGQLLHDVITDKLYTDANLNSVVELIVNAIAGFDANLLDLIGAVLDADIATWFTFCEVNADSKYECIKDWGVDAASDAGAKKAAFVAGLKEVLAPANELLAWLFFGDSYTFFNGSDGEAIITLIGGEGYKQGLVPIFEALGCTMKSADAYYDATTNTYNVGNAVADILDSALVLVDEISANPIEEVFALIPNLLYFINADGLTASVENLLAPLNGVIANLSDVVGADNVQALLFDLIDFNLNDLGIEAILDLLVNETGIVLNDEMLNVICNIYGLGTAADFVSVNGETAYAVDVSGREQDVLTVILTFALELFTLNEELFAGLFGENGAAIVDGIISLLEGYTVAYTDPDWAYMYEGEDALAKLAAVGFPAVEFTYLAYANEWDEPTAQAIYDALDEILVIVMDSVAKGSTIGQLLHGVISDNLYTDANLTAIVELIVNAIAGFDANLLDLIGVVLDADIATWFTFCEVNADGKYECTKDWGVDTSADKKAAFVAGIKEVLAPANQLLSWLFFADDYAFLNGTNGDMITIKGGEGYKQGLVPIFEALGCTMKSADAYYDATTKTYNVGNAVADILDSALALVDEISANPIEEVFALIPNLLYFINADGLTASVENLLAPVNAVLAELNDVVGADNLQALLVDLINFDLSNLGTDAVFALLATKAGFITNAEMVATVKNIYGLGEAASFTSVNDETAYRVDITGREYDVLTVILSFALDAFKLNGTIFSELLGAEQYQAVLNLLAGATEEFEYADINWAYMYDGDLAQLVDADGEFPVRTGSAYTIYTQYQNNWNEATADYLNDVLDTLVQEIVKIAKDENTSIGKMLDNAITRGLYTNSLLNSLIEAVVGALIDYEDIIVKAGVLLDAQGLATWFDDYCTVDAEGNVTCTKDWGIDSATTNEAKRDAFVEGFVEALQPAYRLLAWLLFEKDFEFLTDYAGADHITITGGAGYDEAFVPLLEALGATMKPASAYTGADGNIDMENVVRDVFTALTDILYAICGDLQNPGEKGAIGTMLDLLPNVIYFINADGVKAVVNNLLAPVNFILKELNAFGVEVDFATLIEGIDITNLDWYAVFDIVEDLVPLYFPDFTQEFLATLYMGKAESYTSANGETAYRMVYTEEESRRDMITVVISFVGDAFVDARNKDQLVDWMGEDIYKVLLTYLSGNAVSVEVQEFDWLFTEYAGTGTVLSPMLVGSLNGLVYGKYFTPEMGRYMEENLPSFVDTVIELLGIEAEDGETTYADLEDVLDTLIGDTIYTKANLDAIVTALPELIASLKESLGEELFTMIAEVLNRALGIDLTYWNDYRVADIEDGNREQFVNELIRVLKPTYPILAWLLTGDDLIALFHSADGTGRDMIVVEGAEGYAYGIIPLMEALACENIRTPDEFKIAADSQPENMLRLIIDPILDKVDLILADPVNEIFEVLPAVIYFLNSNGLDTVIKNTANAIFAVLENLEPAIGELDVYKLIGFDPTELNINTMIEQLLTDLEESTGLTFKDMAMDAIVELTVGEVVEFTSKNGETAYTMKYVSAEDRADMTSVILRFVMSFVAVEENARALKVMLKDELSEDGYKFVCALLDNFVDMAKTTDGMDKILYTIYYIFIGAEGVVEGVDGSLDEANDNYKFMQDLFAKSDVEFLNNIAGTLGDFLDSNFKDIVDSDGIIPNGFIKFFQSLTALFEKIINWFKGFFN